jgi:site-specific recombinase XerD
MAESIHRAMQDFLASLNARYTQQTYATPLKHFGTYLAGRGVSIERDPVEALTVNHAVEFVPWLRYECFDDPGQPAKATLQLYLTAIYRFYRSLLKRGVAFEGADIARLEETYRDARSIRGEARPKDPKLAAVEAIIATARAAPPAEGQGPAQRRHELTRLRDIAIVEGLRATGCRVGELAGLHRGDLDWLTHSALVRGKGSKYRRVYLDDVAWMALKIYLQARQDGGDPRALARLPVFCGHGNRSGRAPSPLTTRHVARIVQELAQKAGIAEVGVTPHYFRHVFATRALERTENLALVQDMLGHASPATTRVYAKTDERQRREGYAQVWDQAKEEGPATSMEMAVSVADRAIPDADRRGRVAEPETWDVALLRAISELMLVTGCDPETLLSLRIDDVDTRSRSVRLPEGVGPAGPQVHLDDPAWEALRAYMQMRNQGSRAGTPALFCGMDGKPLTAEGAYALLQSAES